MTTVEQRRLLGAFLRARRERLTPAEAGLHARGTRRRTPGLRREEVALLCGLSPTWYTWLEQGRDVSVSPGALARIAESLRLTDAERAYFFDLTRKSDPAAPPPRESAMLAGPLLSALDTIAVPAYVLDPNWRACGWNAPAGRLFEQWLGGVELNLLRYVFLDASARAFICDWDARARRLAAEFRADTARRTNDAELMTLVDDLRHASPRFAQFWDDHGVLAREGGAREFNHPRDGTLRYQQITLIPAAQPAYKLVMLVGAGGTDEPLRA
jgi:transcriptional regulator with XRE-family HTH domain